jgi:hypothetical protein
VSLGARGSRLVLVADDGATARLFTGA